MDSLPHIPVLLRFLRQFFCMLDSGTWLGICFSCGCSVKMSRIPLEHGCSCLSTCCVDWVEMPFTICSISIRRFPVSVHQVQFPESQGVSWFYSLMQDSTWRSILGWIHIEMWPSNTKAAIGAWIGEQALLGLLFQSSHVSSIAYSAHVGGFAVGVIAAGCFRTLIPLDADGLPIQRTWFIPASLKTDPKKLRHSQHPGPRTLPKSR
jgi:hypothetical protein